MATVAPAPKKAYTLTPEGTHLGILYRFMNLGTRYQEYQGKMKEYADTLVTFTFELPNEINKFTVKKEDGTEEEVEKPFAISREFTLSMGAKSNLRPFVEGIIGTKLTDDEAYAFDLESLVGKACLITVSHKKSADGTKTFASITGTAPLMKGMTVPPQFNESSVQDVNTMTLDEFDKLPKFIQDKISVSSEFKRRFGQLAGETVEEDAPEDEIKPEDIPF